MFTSLASLVTFVVFAGLALTFGLAVAATLQSAEARFARLRRRVDLGRPSDGPTRTLFRSDVGHGLGRPPRYAWIPTLGAAELAGALCGLAVGLAVFGWPVGLFGLAAGLLPAVYRSWRASKRDRAITRQLPGALEVVVSALRAGHAFSETLGLAAGETRAPLRDELLHVVDEHSLGIPMRDALAGLVERHPRSVEVRMFATSVLFQQDAGGNLVDLMEQLASSIRDRVTFEEKARTLTAELRLSTNVLAMLPVVATTAVLLLVPDHFDSLLSASAGRAVLAAAVLTLVGGFLVVHGLIRTLKP